MVTCTSAAGLFSQIDSKAVSLTTPIMCGPGERVKPVCREAFNEEERSRK